MQEVFEKIIKFIEKEIERTRSFSEHDTQINIMDYVKQEAEQYNNGWIPCSERLPGVSGEYYTYVYYDGHYMYSVDEIDCDGIIKEWNCSPDYQIIAWKQIAPYQPKGE